MSVNDSEAAAAHRCDDEGKEDDRSWGCRPGAQRCCLVPMRQEPSCSENATMMQDDSTASMFECREKLIANGYHMSADQSQTERDEGWRKFR